MTTQSHTQPAHTRDPLKDMVLPAWLNNYLETVPTNDVPTKEMLIRLGQEALREKIADVEAFNMTVMSRLAKRLPDKLTATETAAILKHILTFKIVATSSHTSSGDLKIYVPSDQDMWSMYPKAYGTYFYNEDFMTYLMAHIAPTLESKQDRETVITRLRGFAETVHVTTDKQLFPVNNGVYNQETQTLEPFSPDRVFLTKIHVDYVASATNPVIPEPDGSSWDVDSWLNDLSVTPEVNELLWQVIAASLQPNRGMNKSIWFYSESGNNGKGTVGQLIKNLLGQGNYASLSVSDFNREFIKENLLGVAANISDENDVDQYIDSVKDYKASVTGDDIIVNRKHKEPIRLQFRGLNIQMMNGLPKTKDKTGSFYRRLIIVPFIKSFTNNGEKGYIKTDFINRRAVLEYVLQKALTLTFDEFIVPKASEFLLEQYREKNNPVLEFWKEFRDQFVWDLLPKQFLYDLYKRWFERTNPSGTVIGQRTFFDNLNPIIDMDGDWETKLGDNESVRADVHGRMSQDEPLISEYALDQSLKNGIPSPWCNTQYGGSNPVKKRDFPRKEKYRGLLRK